MLCNIITWHTIIEDGFGETLLSREKAKRHEAWITLENIVC